MTDEKEGLVTPTALGEIARANIDIQIATAHAYPRVISHVVDTATGMATRNKQTAMSCQFKLPKGDGIVGPSIRLAEIVATSFKNLRIEGQITDVLEKEVVARCYCHDLESNVAEAVEVRRSIWSNGNKRKNIAPHRYSQDMITTTCMAALAIAKRNAVFSVVPRSIVDDVYEAALNFVLGKARGIDEKREAAIKYFTDQDVTEKELFAFLEIPAKTDMDINHIRVLMAVLADLEEGTTTLDKTFRPKPTPNTATVSTADVKEKKTAKKKVVKTPEPNDEILDVNSLLDLMGSLQIPEETMENMVKDIGFGLGIEHATLDDLSDEGRQLLEKAMRGWKA